MKLKIDNPWRWRVVIKNQDNGRLTIKNGADSEIRMSNVHSECYAETCVIHNPTDHHMREWPLHWYADGGFFVRYCHHLSLHPDPDTVEWTKSQGLSLEHGCDGCCRTP